MKPIWRWCLGVSIGIAMIAWFINWYANNRLKPSMEAKLNAAIAKETDSLYHLTYDQLDISLLGGNVTASNLRLTPDSAAIARHRQMQPQGFTSYEIQIGWLRIRGIGLLRWWLTGHLHIGSIELDTPRVQQLKYARTEESPETQEPSSDTIFDRLSKTGRRITVNRVLVKDGQLDMATHNDATHLHIQHIQTTLRDIQIDSASLRDTSRLYGVGFAEVKTDAVDYIRPDSLYHLQIASIRFDTDTRRCVLRNLRHALTVSKTEFYRRVRLAKDIGTIEISRVSLKGIDIPKWVSEQTIRATALHLDSGQVAIYKDKTKPNPPENKIGKSPHQQLLRLDQTLIIDSVSVNALDVRFTEVSDQTGEAGTVTFEETNALFLHVTNDSVAIASNRYMQLHARSRVMGMGELTVDFRFDLLDSLGGHTYTGKLGAMSGTPFNRMLTPHLHVDIERVAIEQLTFDMEANDQYTKGTLQLDYQDLKVNFIKENEDGGKSVKPVASFLANRFLLNDSNPDANGVHHTGQVYIARPQSFSFFKMIWRSIREGTKECIGL